MKMGSLNVDWKSEPVLREKLLFAIVPILLLIPCVRGFWLPVESAINKSNADLKMIETQATTIKKMLDLTAQEAQVVAATAPEDTKAGGRAMKILNRRSSDKNQEVAGAVSALSSRELTSNILVKNIAVGKEVAFPSYTAIPMDVMLEGGYAAVGKYLKNLESLEKPVLVRGIGITKGKGEGGKLDARVTLWVYLAGGTQNQSQNQKK